MQGGTTDPLVGCGKALPEGLQQRAACWRSQMLVGPQRRLDAMQHHRPSCGVQRLHLKGLPQACSIAPSASLTARLPWSRPDLPCSARAHVSLRVLRCALAFCISSGVAEGYV